MHLVSGDTLFARRHEMHGVEPEMQGDMRTLENCTNRHRERFFAALACPGRSAARSGALQTRDRGPSSWRSRISDALLADARAASHPGHAADSDAFVIQLTISNSPPRSGSAFSAPGVLHRCFAHPQKRVGGASRNVRVLGGTPVRHAITRHARRLRGALRPMTRRTTGGNNITISRLLGVSVPIVSQTEIDPMKTAISLMLALVTTTALTEPAARAEAAGGRAARARTASQGAADAIAQAAER